MHEWNGYEVCSVVQRLCVIAMLLLILLALTNCTSTFEKTVVEPKVDVVYDKLISTWCHMPVDTHMRAIGRKTIQPNTLIDNCSEWRAFYDSIR